ncbi:hypothetical protein D9M68_498250 [compost metagenome]
MQFGKGCLGVCHHGRKALDFAARRYQAIGILVGNQRLAGRLQAFALIVDLLLDIDHLLAGDAVGHFVHEAFAVAYQLGADGVGHFRGVRLDLDN